MFTAIIVDDEPKLREVLKIKLDKFCKNINVLAEAENIDEAEKLLKVYNPDILFLDISMPGGNGFDLIARLSDINFQLIFITGHNEYALDALKISAVDYILKPIKTDELVSAIQKAAIKIESEKKSENYKILKHNLNLVGNQNTKVAIPGGDAYDFVEISDIVRCEGWNKYTKVFLKNGKTIVSSYYIGLFKEMLENYGFYTTHKSHLINTNYISRYLKEGVIIMSDESQVPLARRRKDEFLNSIISKTLKK